jgi:hypothetical protein
MKKGPKELEREGVLLSFYEFPQFLVILFLGLAMVANREFGLTRRDVSRPG